MRMRSKALAIVLYGICWCAGCGMAANPQWFGASVEGSVQPEGDPADWEPGDPIAAEGLVQTAFALFGQKVDVSIQFSDETIGACIAGAGIARFCWKQDRVGPSFTFGLGQVAFPPK